MNKYKIIYWKSPDEAVIRYCWAENDCLEMVIPMKIPNKLYKYRSIKNIEEFKYLKQILVDHQLYLASPKSFSDRFDSMPKFRWEYAEADWEELAKHKIDQYYHGQYSQDVMLHLKSKNMEIKTKEKALEEHLVRLGSKDGREEVKKSQLESFKKTREDMGVLCLCESPLEKQMWQEYGNNFQGVCIGFDYQKSEELSLAVLMQYDDHIPEVKFSLDFERGIGVNAALMNSLTRKHTKFSYEKEWRVIRHQCESIESRKLSVNPQVVKELYIGEYLSIKDKNKIIELCRSSLGKDVRIFSVGDSLRPIEIM